ncbi:MAG: leucine-rich repeat domain-containing protein, partial [Clostridiales bacterium]|nr:leucine-rich repeat domain-containing protein [Clostridiales bacterium]
MKKTVRILLVSLVILVFASICVSALEQDGFTYSYNSTLQGMAITAYSGEDTELVIPAAFDDTPVTYIGKNAFAGKGLTSVQFPDTVACIGVQAFYNNPDLKYVVLPKNLTVIRDMAFRNTGLQVFSAPAGLNTIGNSAFSNTPLIAIYFGGTKAQWEAISFGTGWDDGTSDYTLYYTENDLLFTLENGEAIVADYRGNGVNVVIPQTLCGAPVTAINDYAFSFYDTIQSATLPNGLTSIGEGAFFECESLESVNIPSSVTFIGEGAFMDTSLTEITIPAGIQTIEDSTFSGALLVQATIPASVTTIKANAFKYNEDLADIYYGGTKAEWEAISFGDLWDFDAGLFTVHCSDGDIAPADPLDFLTYTVANGEATVTGFETDKSVDILVIPATLGGAPVTTIGENAFKNSNVLQITLPDSVTSIEANAFKSSNLESINIPSGVFFIGDNAFAFSYLTDVTLPAGLQAINERAFYFAELESITIPASVTYIGNYALARNYELEDIYFGGTKAQWGAIVFGEGWNSVMPEVYTVHCSDGDLVYDPESDFTFSIENGKATITGYNGTDTDIVIPSTLGGYPVTAIGTEAFMESGLTSVVIPEGVTSIGDSAFMLNYNLYSVTIPQSVTYIGSSALSGCNLSTINVPNPDAVLGEWAFAANSYLYDVTLPANLTAIPANLFASCNHLEEIHIPGSVTSIGASAFYNCAELDEINFGGTMAQWNSITFGEGWDAEISEEYTVHCSDGDLDHIAESDFTFSIENGKATITGYNGTDTDIVIPSTLGGYPVTAIGT